MRRIAVKPAVVAADEVGADVIRDPQDALRVDWPLGNEFVALALRVEPPQPRNDGVAPAVLADLAGQIDPIHGEPPA